MARSHVALPLADSSHPPEFFELVESRRSVRSFTAQAVGEGELQRILQAANRAPSAGVADAPIVLVFVANPQRSARRYAERGERLYALQDATIAASYAQLAVHALGLASVWVGAFDDSAVLEAVEAPPGFVASSLLAIGHGAESPPRTPRRDLGDLVHHERLRKP